MSTITTPIALQTHFAHVLDTIVHGTISGARSLQVIFLLLLLLLVVEHIPEGIAVLLSADTTLNAFSLESALISRMPLK